MDKIVNLPENMTASDAELRLAAEKKHKNPLLSVLTFLFFMGIAYGAALVSKADGETRESLQRIADAFLLQKEEDAFLPAFISALLSGGVFLLLLFLFGFSAVGQPFSFFLAIFRGMGLGTAMGHFYLNLGTRGILMSLALIVPAGILSSYAILLAGRESVKLSNRFFRAMTRDGFSMPPKTLKTYVVKFCILTLLLLLSAAVNGICTWIFGPMF